MTKQELRELKIWLIQNTLRQWVEQGMTHEEARKLWKEIEEYDERRKSPIQS